MLDACARGAPVPKRCLLMLMLTCKRVMKQIRQAEANLRRLEMTQRNNPPREQRVATQNAEMLKTDEDYKPDGSIAQVCLASGSTPGEGLEHTDCADLAIRAAHREKSSAWGSDAFQMDSSSSENSACEDAAVVGSEADGRLAGISIAPSGPDTPDALDCTQAHVEIGHSEQQREDVAAHGSTHRHTHASAAQAEGSHCLRGMMLLHPSVMDVKKLSLVSHPPRTARCASEESFRPQEVAMPQRCSAGTPKEEIVIEEAAPEEEEQAPDTATAPTPLLTPKTCSVLFAAEAELMARRDRQGADAGMQAGAGGEATQGQVSLSHEANAAWSHWHTPVTCTSPMSPLQSPTRRGDISLQSPLAQSALSSHRAAFECPPFSSQSARIMKPAPPLLRALLTPEALAGDALEVTAYPLLTWPPKRLQFLPAPISRATAPSPQLISCFALRFTNWHNCSPPLHLTFK